MLIPDSGRLLLLGILLCAGCGKQTPAPGPTSSSGYGDYGDYGYGTQEITFLDSAPANVADVEGLSDLTFTKTDGETTKVRDVAGKNGAVVVVTRGNTNPICPWCSTQTAHYIRDYSQFQERGVEVLIVYPVLAQADGSKLEAFLTDARARLSDPERPVPFPVLLDVELAAVDQLGIRKDLSKPATYIVDAHGDVRYAYVGSHWGDRPTTAAVLKELESLGPAAPPATPAEAAAPEGK